MSDTFLLYQDLQKKRERLFRIQLAGCKPMAGATLKAWAEEWAQANRDLREAQSAYDMAEREEEQYPSIAHRGEVVP